MRRNPPKIRSHDFLNFPDRFFFFFFKCGPLPDDAEPQPSAALLLQLHLKDVQVLLISVLSLVPQDCQTDLSRCLTQGGDRLLVGRPAEIHFIHLHTHTHTQTVDV